LDVVEDPHRRSSYSWPIGERCSSAAQSRGNYCWRLALFVARQNKRNGSTKNRQRTLGSDTEKASTTRQLMEASVKPPPGQRHSHRLTSPVLASGGKVVRQTSPSSFISTVGGLAALSSSCRATHYLPPSTPPRIKNSGPLFGRGLGPSHSCPRPRAGHATTFQG
jgi:hypothetical protein